MTVLAWILLFGWLPLSVLLFFIMEPHRAVLVSVIGGWLILPVATFNVPGLPEYSKITAIALGVFLGGWLSGACQATTFKPRIYDVPMILWCLAPIASALSNRLGLYEGLSVSFEQFMTWGVPYFAGRLYFDTAEKLKDLCLGIVIGGLFYVPLSLYEVRMSPRLSINLYGFFPHSWIQHRRYGGWRPIVFMNHGLMVSLWLAVTTIVAFWLWMSGSLKKLKRVPMPLIVAILAVTTVLAKSGNGWFALALGLASYFVYRSTRSNILFTVLLLTVPLYAILRITGVVEATDVQMVAARFFDEERISSLSVRLFQEDHFVERAMQRPLLGWSRASRAWPVDSRTGEELVRAIDPLWLIVFSFRGFVGFITFSVALLIGPYLTFRSVRRRSRERNTTNTMRVLLGLVVVLFMIDSLVNGMINPVYIVCTGCLVSAYDSDKRASKESRYIVGQQELTDMASR